MNASIQTRELVINWHITEACNYGCEYCYAAWGKQKGARDVVKDMQASRELIREVYDYFCPGNTENPLYGQMQWQSVRLNFAGGEPLLYARQMPELVRFARETGFNTSLITNGSRLTGALLDEIAPHMSWLGLSLDSADDRINQRIGRRDRRGNQLDVAGLARDIQTARAANPDLKLKVNTVVNAANANEDFSSLIHELSPEKWKILRMLPVVNSNLEIDDRMFAEFVMRHRPFQKISRVEDNSEMLESYIMIDPLGRFYQNGQDTRENGYQYSSPILEVGALSAFSGMRFSTDRYAARYSEVA